MDMQMVLPPNAAATSNPMVGVPPRLGSQVPGRTGGLPAQGGLTALHNPMAQQLRSMGRGEDTMLVHMTPDEVNSLQGLAMASGGSLTINPHTGLPEAGWLGKLLPTILGVAGAAFGLPTWAVGLGVGAGQTALTGDLGKGLAAGLQAFGAAGLGQAAGLGGKLGNLGQSLGLTQSATGASNAMTNLAAKAAQDRAAVQAGTLAADKAASAGLLSKFGAETAAGLPGILGKAAPMVAGSAVLGALADAGQPTLSKYNPSTGYEWANEGPYRPMPRNFNPRATGPGGMGEIAFYDNANPVGYLTASGQQRGFAEGGEAKQEERPSWMPEWMQGYKGMYEILGPSSKANEPMVREVLTADQKAALAADSATVRQYYTAFEKARDNGFSAEDLSALDKLKVGLDDAQSRLDYVRNKDLDFTKKYGNVFTLSEGTSSPPPPASGLNTIVDTKADNKADTNTDNKTTLDTKDNKTKPPEEKISVDTLGTTINPLMGGVTSGTGTGATLGDRKLSEGATQSGAGLEVLKDTYTPQFTKVDDFVTAANPANTLGTEALAALPGLVNRYSTSPGAVTALNGYTGGSPSQRIRDWIAKQAEATQAGIKQPVTTSTGDTWYQNETPQSPTDEANNVQLDNASLMAPGTMSSLNGAQYIVNDRHEWVPYTPGMTFGAGNNAAPSSAATGTGTTPTTNVTGVSNAIGALGTEDFWKLLAEASGGATGRFSDNQYVQERARGGEIDMGDGSFVLDARTVSEIGNGSSNAGMELLRRLGGRPLHGPGDGVSDSIPARIGGKQQARVARDEVIMPPEAVRRIGKGSEKRGTDKLYALMDKAHKARKKAKRGQDTKLAKGLGVLA